ncbi:DUF4270 family protein [Ferruginibacter sp. HRS2-29]|uniref:DUF4270 family protein n=1 Tax=Ferruginibacter sp. HRS2-29 TaxID=2487334 RepID=UPI0020CBAF82|nr:DUF4270 family protein [Ferruginibacter sp. HRS2-29]MCP9749702.1 DUF4270 family protein [Ferruginibacter sp. HRS2-29]
MQIFFSNKKMIWLVSVTMLAMFSCDKSYVGFGENFVDNSATKLVYLDSSTIEISTIYVDSFTTTANGTFLCGVTNDPQFGKVSASSYFSIGLPSSTTIATGSVYDSLELILPLNGTYYGDTLSPFHIRVHRLNQLLSFPSGETTFYNTSTVGYNTDVLGFKDIVVRPNASDTVGVRLSDVLGTDLYNKILSNASQLGTAELFEDYLKGLAITGNGASNVILGFTDSVKLRLHYTKPGVFAQKDFIDFALYRNSKQFYNVSVDRTGTALNGIGLANRTFPSASTGHKAYGQYITGSMIKIRFPYLRSLLQLPGFVKIMKAQLVIHPDQNSFDQIFPLPATASMAGFTSNNAIGDYLFNYNSSGSAELQTGDLYIDKVYGKTTAYTYDVTSYLLSQIEVSEINSNGLLLLPESGDNTFDRFVIGDQQHPSNKIQLKIYYASFQ